MRLFSVFLVIIVLQAPVIHSPGDCSSKGFDERAFGAVYSVNLASPFTESFENWPPAGWTFRSPDGGKGWTQIAAGTTPLPGRGTGPSSVPAGGGRYAAFAAPFTGGTGSNDQWLISPAYKVSPGDSLFFWMTADMTYMYSDRVEIRVSVAGNNTADFTELLSIIDFQAGTINPWKKYRYDMSLFSGKTIYIAWRETVTDNRYSGAFVMVDLVRIGPPAMNDAHLLDVALPKYLPPGETEISGTVLNAGNELVKEMEVNWQVGNDPVKTTRLSGLTLLSDNTVRFTCQDKLSTPPGLHSVKVWISNVNGNLVDENSSNDMIFKLVNVASQVVASQPLMEEFTSSTCMPCASFNSTVMLPIMEVSKVPVIKYQMNFPVPGDKYYNADGEIRRQYYDVSSIPALIIEGSPSERNYGSIDARITSVRNTPGLIEIKSRHSINHLTRKTEVKAVIIPYFTESGFKAHIAVVEKKTTGNTGNNGETEFRSVLMKMIPDGNGTLIDLQDNTPLTLQFTADLYNTKTEDFNDLQVIVFVQNVKTKEIFQSAFSEEVEDIETAVQNRNAGKLRIFPNPTGGPVTIIHPEEFRIMVYDAQGRLLQAYEKVKFTRNLDLSSFDKGIYFFKIVTDKEQTTRKIILR